MTKTNTSTTKTLKVAKPTAAKPDVSERDRVDMNDPHRTGADIVNDVVKTQA